MEGGRSGPLFELTANGVNRTKSPGAPEQIVREYPVTYLELKVGDRVYRGGRAGHRRRRAMFGIERLYSGLGAEE